MVISVFVYIKNCVHVQNIVGVLMFFSEERARFFFVSASRSDDRKTGLMIQDDMKACFQKPACIIKQRALPLTLTQSVFLVLVISSSTNSFTDHSQIL